MRQQGYAPSVHPNARRLPQGVLNAASRLCCCAVQLLLSIAGLLMITGISNALDLIHQTATPRGCILCS